LRNKRQTLVFSSKVMFSTTAHSKLKDHVLSLIRYRFYKILAENAHIRRPSLPSPVSSPHRDDGILGGRWHFSRSVRGQLHQLTAAIVHAKA